MVSHTVLHSSGNMRCSTSLIVLHFVVLVAFTEGAHKKDPYAVADLSSKEARTVMESLEFQKDQLKAEFESYADELQADNSLLKAIQAYRSTYEKAKTTECAGEEPPSDSDDDLIMSYIDECDEALPTDDLKVFTDKLDTYKAKVKEIDNTLKTNQATCSKNPTTCEETKNQALEQLDNVYTTEVEDELKSDATGILMKFREGLNKCFERSTKELQDDLNGGVESMKKCMAKHS